MRAIMVLLSRFFEWRNALVVVKPETFLQWYRTAFQTFWRWKSRQRGRPRLPQNLRELIRKMAHDNPTWGEERNADELKLKLGIQISPFTIVLVVGGRFEGPRLKASVRRRLGTGSPTAPTAPAGSTFASH